MYTQPQTEITLTCDFASLGLTDEIFDVITTRALLHWDHAGKYTHDVLCGFIRTLCTRMELDLLCLITATLYMERLRTKFPDAGASSCAKRVLTMGLLTASKYHKVHIDFTITIHELIMRRNR